MNHLECYCNFLLVCLLFSICWSGTNQATCQGTLFWMAWFLSFASPPTPLSTDKIFFKCVPRISEHIFSINCVTTLSHIHWRIFFFFFQDRNTSLSSYFVTGLALMQFNMFNIFKVLKTPTSRFEKEAAQYLPFRVVEKPRKGRIMQKIQMHATTQSRKGGLGKVLRCERCVASDSRQTVAILSIICLPKTSIFLQHRENSV